MPTVPQRPSARAPAPGGAPEPAPDAGIGALHDERVRLNAAVLGGAEVRVWLAGTRWSVGRVPEGPQLPAYRVMALYPVDGASDAVEIAFALADEPYQWGRVDHTVTLRRPGGHRFWAALLKEAGVARHPFFCPTAV